MSHTALGQEVHRGPFVTGEPVGLGVVQNRDALTLKLAGPSTIDFAATANHHQVGSLEQAGAERFIPPHHDLVTAKRQRFGEGVVPPNLVARRTRAGPTGQFGSGQDDN